MGILTVADLIGRSVVICGAGGAGRDAARIARRAGIPIAAFTDRGASLQATFVDGLPVLSLEEGLRKGLPCIISSALHQKEILGDIQAIIRATGLATPLLLLSQEFASLFPDPESMPLNPPDGTDAGRFLISGNLDVLRATRHLAFNTVLDVGCGAGAAADYFAARGKSVVAIGLNLESYGIRPAQAHDTGRPIRFIEASLEAFETPERFDLIWMSHVLEHIQNVGAFLAKVRGLLSEEGWLCVLVPPFKHEVVGGHISAGWNLGQLMYNLLLCGFDIRNGHFITHGYNVAAFVRKASQPLPKLRMDAGDIEATRELWPLDVCQGFNGNIDRVNWMWW